MFFFGAGATLAMLSAGVLLFCWKKGGCGQLPKASTALCLGSCLVLQALYFLFMIPKLGPLRDIDLFFTVYLTVGFVAGVLGDKLLDAARLDIRCKWIECIVAASLGSSAVILTQLLYTGIAPVP